MTLYVLKGHLLPLHFTVGLCERKAAVSEDSLLRTERERLLGWMWSWPMGGVLPSANYEHEGASKTRKREEVAVWSPTTQHSRSSDV